MSKANMILRNSSTHVKHETKETVTITSLDVRSISPNNINIFKPVSDD